MKKRKTMTAMANEYLRHRRKLGYQLHIAGKMLLNFARWADHIGHRGPLTVALAVREKQVSQSCRFPTRTST